MKQIQGKYETFHQDGAYFRKDCISVKICQFCGTPNGMWLFGKENDWFPKSRKNTSRLGSQK